MNRFRTRRNVLPLALLAIISLSAPMSLRAATSAATKRHKHKKRRSAPVAANSRSQAAVIHTGSARVTRTSRRTRRSRRVRFNPWTEPTYADSTLGDSVDGEDLAVRKAAVDALGPYNGSVVVTDAQSGRILSMVNQKLATKGAFQPCSTVKMVVSLASLSEGIVTQDTSMRLSRHYSMDMTQALARSNNMFFAKLGQELGFERVEKYAKLFGLGEKAGLDIPGEEAGYLTSDPPQTGVGMMTSFGDGIRLTPLELTSIVSTIANNGTMYYLQYPQSQEDIDKFVPRIKRELEIANFVPEIKPGMMGAVEYGTARRANFDPNDPIFGKTGTCTDTAQPGVHLGWFGSFNDVGTKKLVVVVLLTGGRGVSGPIASGIAGNVYRNLAAQNYFGPPDQAPVPTTLVSMQN
jgi:cell division protein FtsI/penicillin-binding protein 2